MTPVVLFVFNRPDTTERVLAAIRGQTRIPGKLTVFADGARDLHDGESVRVVRDLIRSIDWTDVRLIERERNLGCAQNILRGLGEVFQSHERVAILEDDTLPSTHWYESMCVLLDYYSGDTNVFSVGGFPSIKTGVLSRYPFDVIMSPRFSCWGWGTWADRWYAIIDQIVDFKNPFGVFQNIPFDAGFDLESSIRLVEEHPSMYWDIPLALVCLSRGMLHALTKYYLVQNIGTHSGTHGTVGPLVKKYLSANNNMYNRIPRNFPLATLQPDICRVIQRYVGEINTLDRFDHSPRLAPIDHFRITLSRRFR